MTSAVTYYDRPVLKAPVWIWTIPLYFFVGGVAGASMTLGLAAQLLGGWHLRRFDERCRWIGAIGGGIGTVLLIADLGRKERFLAMLRVFRPTSPMSVGSWVLATATPLSAGSALLTFAHGALGRLGSVAGMGAGALGMPLATYTGVLLSNSTVPVWSATRHSLPLLFGASSMASLASVLDLMPLNRRERAIVRTFGILGRAAEVMMSHALEHDACECSEVGRALTHGLSGAFWKSAKMLAAGSLVLSLIPGENSTRRRAAGVLSIAAGLAVRFAIFHAGKVSANDPRATFAQQAG